MFELLLSCGQTFHPYHTQGVVRFAMIYFVTLNIRWRSMRRVPISHFLTWLLFWRQRSNLLFTVYPSAYVQELTPFDVNMKKTVDKVSQTKQRFLPFFASVSVFVLFMPYAMVCAPHIFFFLFCILASVCLFWLHPNCTLERGQSTRGKKPHTLKESTARWNGGPLDWPLTRNTNPPKDGRCAMIALHSWL